VWEAWKDAQCEWAGLVREMFRSPFREVEAPRDWPLNVVELATAIYQGEDCGFALHDALTEAGQTELAEHFAVPLRRSRMAGPPAAEDKVMAAEPLVRPRWHPKGCWVVDLILGKK
jgi:hypothetical protein